MENIHNFRHGKKIQHLQKHDEVVAQLNNEVKKLKESIAQLQAENGALDNDVRHLLNDHVTLGMHASLPIYCR